MVANNGVPLPVRKLLLGHSGADVTMLYVHSLEAEARDAVEVIAPILFPIVPDLGGARIEQGAWVR